MGLIQKKGEKDEIDGIQIIERGEGPDGDEEEKIDLVAGTSAEHIAAGTTAEEEDARLEAKIAADAADENLMPEEQDEDDDILGSDEDDRASKHKKTMIAAFVVAVVIAAVVGFFIGNGGFGGKGVGSATLTEDQLDSTVASYKRQNDITAREAMRASTASTPSRMAMATTPLPLPTSSCPTCATRSCSTLPRTRASPSLLRR
ncbi:MAG: hypothetical protein ACLRX0_02065 [Collinsella aerofaciens]